MTFNQDQQHLKGDKSDIYEYNVHAYMTSNQDKNQLRVSQ
jgi:hypothetical protein